MQIDLVDIFQHVQPHDFHTDDHMVISLTGNLTGLKHICRTLTPTIYTGTEIEHETKTEAMTTDRHRISDRGETELPTEKTTVT